MKIIERETYIKELASIAGTPDIKIITGIRRSGKSMLMRSFVEYIQKHDENANIIYADLNSTEYESLLDCHKLEDYAEKNLVNGKNNYFMVDEIELCPGFEKAINSLHSKGRHDIYITGSNAFLQSSDLATLFVGRSYEMQVFPFSFKEYLTYYPSSDIYGSFSRYISDGGMAGSYLYNQEEQRRKYINNGILNTLIVRDIQNKYKIRNTQLMNVIIDYLMDSVGSIVSCRKIQNTLTSSGNKADNKTIGRYIEYLCRAFAFYKVRRYDIKGKRYLHSDDKYYLADHGFKYAHLGTKNMNYGHIIENIAAIELMRRGYEVYAGYMQKKEIDFVAIRRGVKNYIQVCYDLSDRNTFEREISSLLSVRDAYPKIILARTYQPEYQYEGIRIIDIADWLLQ